MKLRLAPNALGEAKQIKTWWRENRPAAPHGELEAPVRRVLLPKTKNHVYYAVEGDEIVVVSIWGAPKEHGPKR
jgi:hypothetical protein